MSVQTYTKSGTKATSTVKLDKSVFGLQVSNHELIKQAYVAYLANGRLNLAVAKTRGQVRGGGRKPWKQKGTGRARFGSSRNPIWRGGGITFGPTGNENYSHKITVSAKHLALRQALSICSEKIKVVESFAFMENKTKEMVGFLNKIDTKGRILCVVSEKDSAKERATKNIPDLKVVSAKYLNVYDILNADSIIISQKSLALITSWLGAHKKSTNEVEK